MEKWGTQLPVDLAARVQLPLLALPLFFIAAGSAPDEFSVVIGASKNDNNSVGSEYFSVKFFGRTSIKIWKTFIYNSHQIIEFENYVVVPKYEQNYGLVSEYTKNLTKRLENFIRKCRK